MSKSFAMQAAVGMVALVCAMVVMEGQANARFKLFSHHGGGGCGCAAEEASCGCAAEEPSCAAEPLEVPSCRSSCAAEPELRGRAELWLPRRAELWLLERPQVQAVRSSPQSRWLRLRVELWCPGRMWLWRSC